jgi:hypothetical protein
VIEDLRGQRRNPGAEPPPPAKRPTPPSEAFGVHRGKHQWQWPPGVSDHLECAACGATAEVINLHVGAGIIQSECSAVTVAGEYVELSTEVLTRITEDLWVNPAQVVMARSSGSMTQLTSTDGLGVVTIDKPLYEVVALLNGSA